MANKYMKRCCTAYVIKEVWIKITMRCCYILIRVAQIQNAYNIKCWLEYGRTGTLVHCWWKYAKCTAIGRQFDSFLKKAKHSLTIWSRNHTPVIYPREMKTYDHTKPCTRMIKIVLLIISTTWMQPWYPSIDNWINKLCYINMIKYFLALKNELSNHEKPWSKFICILLRKRS